jgi:toxin-antitoxin system PIN domain toxin
VIALDTNILVYAHRAEMAQHAAARAALAALAEGDEPFGVPVTVATEFLRVVTHPRVFRPPTDMPTARAALDAVLDSPSARLLAPGPRHRALLAEAIEEGDATGNLVLDAAIVATCREHAVRTILTNDLDFRRFPSIEVAGLPPG